MINDIDELLESNRRLTIERDDLLLRLQRAEASNEAKQEESAACVSENVSATKVTVPQTSDPTYRKFIENMPEGVITLSADGTILYSNNSFAKVAALPLEKVIGSNLMDFIPPGYKAIFKKSVDDSVQSDSKVEISILNARGLRSHFTVSVKKLQLQDLMAISLVWTDVTDQKKVEAELISANRALKEANDDRVFSEAKVNTLNDELNSNIKILKDANLDLATFVHLASHDLQEPLRKISTYTSLVAQNYNHVIDKQGIGYLKTLQNASLKMSKLITDVLEYLTLSQNEALFTMVNLNTLFDQVFLNFKDSINGSEVNLVRERDMPVIEADHNLVLHLFRNLLSNSLKFKKPAILTEISVSFNIMNGKQIDEPETLLRDEEFCVISIRDNGIGFDQDYVTQIFLAFKRLNSSFIYPGTGIGLAICKKIVEKHSGFITAESKIGEGSTFKIILPVQQVGTFRPD